MDSKWRSSEQGSSLCFWMFFESAYEAKSQTVYVIVLHWWFSFWLKMALSLRRDLLLILWTQCLCRHQLWAPRSFWDTMYGLVECQPWKESDHRALPHHFPCGKAMPRDTELIGGLGARMHLCFFYHTILPELKPCPPTRITRHGERSLTSGNFLQWVDRTPQWWTSGRWCGQNAGGCRRRVGLREFSSKGPGVWEG